ncbi:MAG: hypothetical protein LBG27_03415 [Spirochaetaceae bacterium]|jgi:hypothetical protein|nr:hypothetical protein [Spirochaetaceae bacterium]
MLVLWYPVEVRKIAKLLLYFSLTFTILFLLSAGLGVLHVWMDAVSSVPARSFVMFADCIPAVEWALPFTLYMTTLMAMSYACRTRISTLGAFVVLFIFAFGFTYVVSLGINNAKGMDVPPMSIGCGTLGKPGLTLSGRGMTVVVLDDPANGMGERVVSFGDRPLLYQSNPVMPDGSPIPLPSAPFTLKNIALFDSLLIDFSLAAKELSARFVDGFMSYAAYSGAVIFILLSLVAVLDIGVWPLANIFIGAVLFRLVLSFEVFICQGDTLEYLANFLSRWIPAYLVVPCVIGAMGVLIAVYSGLVFAAGNGRSGERRERHHG